MNEPEQCVRRHYEAQQLAPAQVKTILAAGSAAAGRRLRLRTWKYAAAAAIMLGMTGWFIESGRLRSNESVPLTDVAAAVVNYFSPPVSTLPVVSEDRARLREWVGSQGGPTQFVIPPAFARLKSVGCEVLDVRGHQVALLCFFLDATSLQSVGTAPDTVATAGPQLVHLLVIPSSSIIDTPSVGQRVQLEPTGHWRVIAWEKNDLVYFAATDVAAVQLAEFANAL